MGANELMRGLPRIDALLRSPEASRHVGLLGRAAVLGICRGAVERAKQRVLAAGLAPDPAEISAEIATECRRARSLVLGRVINGTGVILHTNLGRAPLGAALFADLAQAVGGYCNLEIDVLERTRGGRGPHVSSLLAQACAAEDAIVVNNNAAALFLILREFAAGREVVVSRGELVQIGGGFRIPDILESTGATLREVGTTNITTLDDFRGALGDDTALLLKVHHSNFHMAGFVESPAVRELARFKSERVLLVSDLGTGNLARRRGGAAMREPTPADMLEAGADLVCFSCDKLLGGVQGGVIAGRAELVARLRRNPVMRVIRVDKLAYAALQHVLSAHLAGEQETIPIWRMAGEDRAGVAARAAAFLVDAGIEDPRAAIVDSEATFGGGSTPGEVIPSAAIRLVGTASPDATARWFQDREPPVLGTVKSGAFQLDFRTILPEDEPFLARIILGWLGR
jgi:L-seryl-tRNA(Ser) seleniumtransferase